MINRELIRLKTIQVSYSYYVGGRNNLDAAEKELFLSLSKSYDLYNYLLLLMVEVNRIAERAYDTAVNRCQRLNEGEQPSPKFIQNKFLAQLEANGQLREFVENQKLTWADDEDFLRRLYKQITECDSYKEYMSNPEESTYQEDRELWRQIYRQVFVDNEELDALLEEKGIYWNDDRFIIDTFILKTMNRFEQKNGTRQVLQPEFKDEEDKDFARKLLRSSLLGTENYRSTITQFLRGWDLERLAVMDVIILQTALAEIMNFPNIPVSVSINEYVNIAKMYSTPQSGRYINGLLDNIARQFISDGRLQKSMGGKEDTPEGK
ncbi:MAG: transcription antitermination factor NusB [Bacteroidaceae bacterium]|nr:transcription antitermination factor NusB [Bacteroidaceae bacterium]